PERRNQEQSKRQHPDEILHERPRIFWDITGCPSIFSARSQTQPVSNIAFISSAREGRRRRACGRPHHRLCLRPRCSATPQFPSSAPTCGVLGDLSKVSCTTSDRLS